MSDLLPQRSGSAGGLPYKRLPRLSVNNYLRERRRIRDTRVTRMIDSCAECEVEQVRDFTYNASGKVVGTVAPGGGVTQSAFDPISGLEVQRVEAANE